MQLLPAFSHIGQQRLLLPQGAVPAGAASLAAASVAAEPAAAASGGAPAAQRPWAQLQPLGLHSMRHYRSRAASLCWRALGQSQQAPAAAADPPIELSRSLAPPLLVQQAAAPLLVLQPSPPGSWQPYEAAVPLTVAVSGSGLELCTRALLQFPGAQLPALAATEVSLAKQQLLAVSQAAGSSSSDSSSALGRFRSAAGRALHRTQAAVQQEQAAQPDLLLRFVVPAAALQQLALQQRGPALHMPQAELTLLSDFGRQAASVQLQPAVVWAFGLDAAMSGAVVHRLQVAAADAAAAAAEQRWLRRPSLPSQAAVAAPLRGLWGGGMGGAGGTGGSSEPPSGAAEAGSAEPEPQQLSRLARLRQQATARAAERLAGLRQQWSSQHQPAAQAADSELPPTAVLLPSGVLLLDAAPALLGDSGSGGSVAQQLELAAGALQWSAQQRQQQHAAGPAAGQGSAALQRAGWEQEEQQQAGMEEVDEEELAELAQLGIGAKLRRQLARTAAAAQRRAALARHRRRQAAQLQALPPPDVVLLLLHHQQLLSSGFGEGLDGAVLAAVRQLAAACAACGGAPLLLAVASAAPLSTPYRWHLADACGLGEAAVDGSSGSSMRGSVVPLLLSGPAPGAWEPPAGSQAAAVEAARVEPLQAALHVYAARRQGRREQSAWQGAPRSRL